MRNFKLKIAAMALTILAPISASADDTDVVLTRVQSLEKELTAVKRENEVLRQIKTARAETAALSKSQAIASIGKHEDPRMAYATDLPVKAPPPPALATSWAGFYLGIHAGYGRKGDDFATVVGGDPTVTVGGINSKGWVGGGLAGFNWQDGPVVGGLELDFSYSNIRGSSAPAVLYQQP